MVYTLMCNDGHSPDSLEIESASENEAEQQLIDWLRAHNAEKHPELNKSDDDLKYDVEARMTRT